MNLLVVTLSGMDGIAPFFVIQRNAALLPNIIDYLQLFSHFDQSLQSDSKSLTQKAEVKQSPAPTVSIILYFVRIAGFILVATSQWIQSLSVIKEEPFEPNLSKTLRFLYFAIILVLISSTGLSTSTLGSILRTSVSLGEMISRLCKSYSGMTSSLPPQSRITILPFSFAYLAASTFIFMGISFCSCKSWHRSIAYLQITGSQSKLSQLVFAPPTITIEFQPLCSSTQIKALPVGVLGNYFHDKHTLAYKSSFFKFLISSSWPTCPVNIAPPANLPAAAAWLAPLPPLAIIYLSACIVQPGTGMCLTQTKESTFALPSTQILYCF